MRRMAVVRVVESLRARISELVAPLREAPHGYRLSELETEQGIRLLFRRDGGAAINIELEAADEARPCFARTARFNVYYARLGLHRGELTPPEAALLDRVVAVIREREPLLPAPSVEVAEGKRVMVREIEEERVLFADEAPRAYYLNPYVGCMLACPFCYAIHRADFSRALVGLPRAPWGKWVDVKINAPEVLARELGEHEPGTVRMSPIVTDPYQPVERRYRITRRCIEVMQPTAYRPAVLTRSSLVREDLPLLARCHQAIGGVSIPTDDEEVLAALEPGTEPVSARVETLRAIREAGLTTFAILQPMLPLDPGRLVDLVAPWAEAVRIGPLFEKHRVRAIYERLGRTEALDDAWERSTFAELSARFEARGVPVNPAFEPWSLFL